MRSFAAWLVLLVAATASAAAPRGELSAAALYNTANGYARANKTGLAVLYYERARLLDPANADIDVNLRIVRSSASLPPNTPHWYDALARIGSPTLLAWIGLAGIVMVGVWLIGPHTSTAQRRSLRLVACAGILALAAPVAQAWVLWPLVHSGVVITNAAEARASPVSLGDAAFTVPAGELVRIASVHQGYLLIRTAAGHSGWVPAQSIVAIVP